MRWDRRWVMGVAFLALLLFLPACREAATEEADGYQPATLQPIDGTELSRVILTEDAAQRIRLETGTVSSRGDRLAVPESAVWIDEHGEEWVYTELEPLVFVRKAIRVDRYEDGVAVLSDGPPAGTVVVTVGVAELIGVESGL
jgi:hypothetical protein